MRDDSEKVIAKARFQHSWIPGDCHPIKTSAESKFVHTRPLALWLRYLGTNAWFLIVLSFYNVDRHLALFSDLHFSREKRTFMISNFKNLDQLNLKFWSCSLCFLLSNHWKLFSELHKGIPWGKRKVMVSPSTSLGEIIIFPVAKGP